MSCNDVYMIMYARKARQVNKMFADARKTGKPVSQKFLDRFGD